jgi:NAD-dependent dihydropyrimidine dehydrogenase PreA subunit
MEMALAWAFPCGLVVAGLAALLRPAWALPLAALVAALAALLFAVYDRVPPRARKLAAPIAALGTAFVAWLAGGGGAAVAAGGVAGLGLTALLTYDYDGSTPTAGGSHFEERRWHVALDPARCAGVYRCVEVCPEACFERVPGQRVVTVPHGERCIRCGACVVQCPKDALAFEDEDGRRIDPERIRRFKLTLLGRRGVDVGAPGAEPGSPGGGALT